jgi:CRM1 C terminal
MDPANIDAKEMAALCVELYGGVARAGEMVASERIAKFLTPSLAHLAGLMAFYAEDLTICESLLRLFRDYAEQFIAVLDSESCLALFHASADLLKSYSAVHCASTRVIAQSWEEEQSYNDILCAIQLLIQLGTKDFIGYADTDGLQSSQVTDMIFFGLQQLLPLMTRGLLQFPTLCTQYFSLVGFMMETYPEKVKDLPYELLNALLESLLYGMSHYDTSVAKASLQGLAGIVKEHLQHRVLDIHLAKNAELFDNCSHRLLMEVIFQSCVWDRIETAGMALLHLSVVDLNRFGNIARSICQNIPAEQQPRLLQAFQQLLQDEVLSKVFAAGYEGRQARARFKKDFEHFCHDVHAFLVLK